MPTQAEIAEHLDMSERNARDVLNSLADKHGLERDWWKSTTLDNIRVKYIRDMRDKAAGRGGDDQFNLTKQRAREAEVNSKLKELEYGEKLGQLIVAEEAAAVLIEWATASNREYQSVLSKLVGEIQSVHKIEIDNNLVDNIAGPGFERIQAHAADIGRRLAPGSGDIQAGQDPADS